MKATVFTCESKEDVLEELKKVFDEAEAERTRRKERKGTVDFFAKAIGHVLSEAEFNVKLETLCVSFLATIYATGVTEAEIRGHLLCVIENLIAMDRCIEQSVSKTSEPESPEHSEPDAETSPEESSQD